MYYLYLCNIEYRIIMYYLTVDEKRLLKLFFKLVIKRILNIATIIIFL